MRRKRWRRRIRFLLSRGWGIGFSFDTIGAWLYDGAMTDVPHTPLLDTVDVPADLRKLKPEQLRQFADELRAEMISAVGTRSEEHTSELQSLMRISYAVFCLKKK